MTLKKVNTLFKFTTNNKKMSYNSIKIFFIKTFIKNKYYYLLY